MTACVRQRFVTLRTFAIACLVAVALAACGATTTDETPTPTDGRFDSGATFDSARFR